jgi:hypothetical protein
LADWGRGVEMDVFLYLLYLFETITSSAFDLLFLSGGLYLIARSSERGILNATFGVLLLMIYALAFAGFIIGDKFTNLDQYETAGEITHYTVVLLFSVGAWCLGKRNKRRHEERS